MSRKRDDDVASTERWAERPRAAPSSSIARADDGEARRAARSMAAMVLEHIQPGAKLQPLDAVRDHLGLEAVALRADELDVDRESFRLWIMAAVVEAWPR